MRSTMRSPNTIEEKKKRIERKGFKVSRVVSEAYPGGLWVARIGALAWFDGKTINELHRKIFGY